MLLMLGNHKTHNLFFRSDASTQRTSARLGRQSERTYRDIGCGRQRSAPVHTLQFGIYCRSRAGGLCNKCRDRDRVENSNHQTKASTAYRLWCNNNIIYINNSLQWDTHDFIIVSEDHDIFKQLILENEPIWHKYKYINHKN